MYTVKFQRLMKYIIYKMDQNKWRQHLVIVCLSFYLFYMDLRCLG